MSTRLVASRKYFTCRKTSEDRMEAKEETQTTKGLAYWFGREKGLLAAITVTGILYNVGMTAGPYFEGLLAQRLYDIIRGKATGAAMITLCLTYVAVIAFVQFCRFLKRLYVRRFANNTSRNMKNAIYRALLARSTAAVREEDAGALMTKAVSDVEDCTEGMRKFTTEVFDTGVVMVAYVVMLALYDWRLTLISLIFPPLAYVCANRLKARVTGAQATARQSLSRLNSVTEDRMKNAVTYRIYGQESRQEAAYEACLSDYEKKNIRSGIWQNSSEPVYLVISLISVIPIFIFGSKNVAGSGWTAWSIASFSTFLSCFLKLATKSSHAAKLFNAIQKAEVSWARIRPYFEETPPEEGLKTAAPAALSLNHVTFAYEPGKPVLTDVSFTAAPGQIIGLTGEVASGKSTFGTLFLSERPYEGTITYGGRGIGAQKRYLIFGYAGHAPELFSDTLENNVTLGRNDPQRLRKVLAECALEGEFAPTDHVSEDTVSGGQAARIALARALYSTAPVLILDDPFAAVDRTTEEAIFAHLRQEEGDRIILIISHRLELFDRMDEVLFLEDGALRSGTHEELLDRAPAYRHLNALAKGGPAYV